MFLVVGHID